MLLRPIEVYFSRLPTLHALDTDRVSEHKSFIPATMASQLDKKLLSNGNGKDYPKVGDEVTIEYTGWLHDPSKADQDYKGNKYVIALDTRMRSPMSLL